MSGNVVPVEAEFRPAIPQAESDQLRKDVLEHAKRVTVEYITLGFKLKRVKELSLYRVWGFATYADYISREVNFEIRKADTLIQIYSIFVDGLGVDEARFASVGWSKARLIKDVVDVNNVDEWLDRAEKMSVTELEEAVRKVRGPTKQLKSGPVEAAEQPEPPEAVISSDDEGFTAKLTVPLTESQHRNITRALNVAAKMAESTKIGHRLDLICTAFLASDAGMDIQNEKELRTYLLEQMENRFELKILAYDSRTGRVIFGEVDETEDGPNDETA